MSSLELKNLWGEEFVIPETTAQIIKKIKAPKEIKPLGAASLLKSKKLTIEDKLNLIKLNVIQVLGRYKDKILIIRTKAELVEYIDKAIKNGIISIDTETNNSLDPLTCKLLGPCIYTPGLKPAYIPLNHVDYKTNERLPWQLNEHAITEQFSRLKNTKILMHNADFDYRVIKCTCGVELIAYWDSYIAARLLDENERSAGLKQQYIDKIDAEQQKYDIEHLFESILYEQVDPEIFALYAAMDALMTYKLYEWQKEKFKNPDLAKVYKVFRNIEMPLIKVVANMELRGIKLDLEYAKRLSIKYHKLIDELNLKLQKELSKYEEQINKWKLTPEANVRSKKRNGEEGGKSKVEQLENPINLDSPKQLSILLYDILKCPQVSKKSPRGTGVDELTSLVDRTGLILCSLILEKRTLDKLINTFIDKLPESINNIDNKIHPLFLSVGTDTGRFASASPNLQNIPAHNKEIRVMFCADPGKMLVGADYSAQEVRMTAYASQDPDMIKAYTEGKDLYSVIATTVYKNKYEDNLEYYPEGTEIIFEGNKVIAGNKTHLNKEGKARRQSCKSILIGSIYGRGAASISEQIGRTKEETQKIMDKFFEGFPRIAQWMEESRRFTFENGYMENWYGRRRRLPDIQLPRYTIKAREETVLSNFNPLLGCENRVDDELIQKYTKLLSGNVYFKDYEEIRRRAYFEGLEIHDNNGLISQAERQCVNFQCQSGGAELTKLSMIAVDNNKELKDLGFELLLTIHDEIMGQCPIENVDRVAEILPKIMVNVAINNNINVPMQCDSTCESHWYETEMISVLNEEFNKLCEDKPKEEAYAILVSHHTELLESQIYGILYEHKDLLFE